MNKLEGLLGVALPLGNIEVIKWFHAGEGFHLEKLWDLLRTAGLVVLGLVVMIGLLWVVGRWREHGRLHGKG